MYTQLVGRKRAYEPIDYERPLAYDSGEVVDWRQQCTSAVELAGRTATEAALESGRPQVVERFLAAASILGGSDDFQVAVSRQAAYATQIAEDKITHPYTHWEGPQRPNVAAMFMQAVEASVPGMMNSLAAADYSALYIHDHIDQFRQDAMDVAIASVPTPSPWLS